MSFQIKGLPAAEFAPLFSLSDGELRARNARRVIADKQPGFPCRVSLRDADPGETLILLNYEHLPLATPYRSRHAIYVRQNAIDAHLEVNEIPQMLRTRLLSLRAFDGEGLMVEADVMPGSELGPAIQRMLERDSVAYLHVHNARQGCYAARVDRAWHD
jgi:hypothetical protein